MRTKFIIFTRKSDIVSGCSRPAALHVAGVEDRVAAVAHVIVNCEHNQMIVLILSLLLAVWMLGVCMGEGLLGSCISAVSVKIPPSTEE